MTAMLSKERNVDPVIIIGAGLSGLACAATLKKNDIPYLIIEKSNQVGGRVQTSVTNEGYRLDHGFQVLLTSYPELKNFIDLKKLNLKLFNSGSLIFLKKTRLLANPLLHPSRFFTELFSDLISFKDKLLVLKLVLLSWLPSSHKKLKQISTIQFLNGFGFSQNFINIFWRPFLKGVFLDPNLSIGADFFVFLIKGFSQGRVAVPALGMQQIPLQMANGIDFKNIRLNTSVQTLASDHVFLDNGEKIKARNVVVAFNPNPDGRDYFSVQNFYFTTSEKIDWGSWLLLVPQNSDFTISTIAVMNHVSADYGIKPTEHLLSTSVVSDKPIQLEKLAAELRLISGLPLLDLKFIEKFEILKALPKMSGFEELGFKFNEGIYFCGDWAVSPSINGALKSGRLIAEAIS